MTFLKWSTSFIYFFDKYPRSCLVWGSSQTPQQRDIDNDDFSFRFSSTFSRAYVNILKRQSFFTAIAFHIPIFFISPCENLFCGSVNFLEFTLLQNSFVCIICCPFHSRTCQENLQARLFAEIRKNTKSLLKNPPKSMRFHNPFYLGFW